MAAAARFAPLLLVAFVACAVGPKQDDPDGPDGAANPTNTAGGDTDQGADAGGTRADAGGVPTGTIPANCGSVVDAGNDADANNAEANEADVDAAIDGAPDDAAINGDASAPETSSCVTSDADDEAADAASVTPPDATPH